MLHAFNILKLDDFWQIYVILAAILNFWAVVSDVFIRKNGRRIRVLHQIWPYNYVIHLKSNLNKKGQIQKFVKIRFDE